MTGNAVAGSLMSFRIVATAFSIAGDPSVAPTAPIGIILLAGQARPIQVRPQGEEVANGFFAITALYLLPLTSVNGQEMAQLPGGL